MEQDGVALAFGGRAEHGGGFQPQSNFEEIVPPSHERKTPNITNSLSEVCLIEIKEGASFCCHVSCAFWLIVSECFRFQSC